MKKEFVMRGQTASSFSEVLNFSGNKLGYAYRLTDFRIFPSTNVLGQSWEQCATLTAGKTALDPENPNFEDEGLIGTALSSSQASQTYPISEITVINDTFLITQNLILLVKDTHGGPVNWQCRFVSVKMSGPEEATANYKQFTISDE